MKRKAAFFLMSILLVASSGRPEVWKRPIEIFAFAGLNFGGLATSYANTHALGASSLFQGSYGTQSLQLLDRAGAGVCAGFALSLMDNLALKFSAAYARIGMGGENGPYRVHLQYLSQPPPDYTPRQVVLDQSFDGVSTEGNLKNFALLLGLRYDLWSSRAITAAISVGGGVCWNWGDFNPLAYSDYWLGGHSVLFSEQYLIMLRIPASVRVAWTMDFELGLRVSDRVSLLARIGYLDGGAVAVTPAIASVLSSYSLDPIDDSIRTKIENRLALPPLSLHPSFLSLRAGFTFSFGRPRQGNCS